MKKKDLFALRDAIVKCKDLKSSSFAFCLVMNSHSIEEEIKAMDDSKIKQSKELEEFYVNQRTIIESLAKKDGEGKFIELTQPNGIKTFDFDNLPLLNSKLKDLNDEYPELMEEIEKINNDFENLLNKEISSELLLLEKEDIPSDITPEMLSGLYPILKKTEKKPV